LTIAICSSGKLFSIVRSSSIAVDLSMKLKLAPGLCIQNSKIHGKGCFATKDFKRRRKIAEYAGEKISNAEARRRAHRKTLRICEVNRRWSLDGSRGGNGTHYINHSCEPNAFMQILYDHILFIALRDIQSGEEITIDYESTLHSDSKRCVCCAPFCRGTINRV
jgi:uncharacterized protein